MREAGNERGKERERKNKKVGVSIRKRGNKAFQFSQIIRFLNSAVEDRFA